MPKIKHNLSLKQKRAKRVRTKFSGTAQRPRVSVFRSNHHIYLQAIDDLAGKTLVGASDVALSKEKKKMTKVERAVKTAKVLAEGLKKKKVEALVFDRGSYRYHGRVKAVAETLREAGLNL